jgi:hypothetical protein
MTIEMPFDRLFEKAKNLLKTGKVEALGGGKYNVVGDHGTYIVFQNYDGKLSCNCLGFLNRGKCSHSTAVLLRSKSLRTRRHKISEE